MTSCHRSIIKPIVANQGLSSVIDAHRIGKLTERFLPNDINTMGAYFRLLSSNAIIPVTAMRRNEFMSEGNNDNECYTLL